VCITFVGSEPCVMKLLTEFFGVLSMDATTISPTEPSIGSLVEFHPNRNDSRRLTPTHLLAGMVTSGWEHAEMVDLVNPHT
jgi:hypothetical protein